MNFRSWFVIVLAACPPANGFAVIDGKHAAPDFERVLGGPDRCYEPSAGGPSIIPSGFLIAGTTHRHSTAPAPENRSPFLLSVDFEGKSREIALAADAGPFIEVRGAIRLDDDTFVVAGVKADGQVLELLDGTGKVKQTAKLSADVNVRGIERGSSKDFVVYGNLGSRPYYAGLNRSLAVVFERFPAIDASYGQVLKARYSVTRDGIFLVVQGTGASPGDATVTLVKDDLLGNRIASTAPARSIYADFDEGPDGIALLYYTAADAMQNIHLAYFDKALELRWRADPARAQMGVLGPRVAVLKDKVLVVAANDFKLLLAALDLKGQALWTYREAGPSLSPGSTYLVAHDATRLLIAQPDLRAGDATHEAPDPSCTRIRVVRF